MTQELTGEVAGLERGSSQGSAQVKVKKPGTFEKNDPRIRQNKERIEKEAAQKVPEEAVEWQDDPERVLRDLRWAYANLGRKLKGTPQQEAFRKLLTDEPRAFLEMMGKQEVAVKAGKRARAKSVADRRRARADAMSASAYRHGLVEHALVMMSKKSAWLRMA